MADLNGGGTNWSGALASHIYASCLIHVSRERCAFDCVAHAVEWSIDHGALKLFIAKDEPCRCSDLGLG